MKDDNLNEGVKDYFKEKAKKFLDDDEKIGRIEKAGKVSKTIANTATAITTTAAAGVTLHKGYKLLKKKLEERKEKKKEEEKLKKKKAKDVKKSEGIEIFNLVNEDLDLVVFLDEDGDIFFMEEEIDALLECYDIEEEDLCDMIFSENSNFEIVDLSENKVKDFFGGIKDRVTSSDRKVKPEHDLKLKGMISDLQKEVAVVNDNMDKNNNNVYNMSAKVDELDRKCDRTIKLAVGLGIAIPAALLGIKAVIDHFKKKRANEEAAARDKKKAKKLKESTINALLSIDVDSLMEASDIDALVEQFEEQFEPFMQLVHLDENTVIDVYFTESGLFIDEETLNLVLESYDDLSEEDIYELISDQIDKH